jgi:hypothetical protein
MQTITGLFDNPDEALRAGEKLKEVAGPRASVRVIVPGKDGKAVETKVLEDTSSYTRVPFIGLSLGLLFAIAGKIFGLDWGLTVLALLVGVGTGMLLSIWLTGEAFRRRIYSREVGMNRSVVSAVVSDMSHASNVLEVLRSSGGRVAI